MTILQELASLYDRRRNDEGWPMSGFSSENIGVLVVLNEDGSVDEIQSLLAPDKTGKIQPRQMAVPAAVKRTAGIRPNILWDKTAYTLGVTKTPTGPGQGKRTIAEHEAFTTLHIDLLKEAADPALTALRRFCETWDPAQFIEHADADGLIDQNVVFCLKSGPFLHDLPDAKDILANAAVGTAKSDERMCLVSGRRGPVARLHPPIKGVRGAQSSGAALVSFNDAAYTSHGKSQGQNAPVSEAATFAYTTALNALLKRGSGNNLLIGGDTVVFWAEQPVAEFCFEALISGNDDAATERELNGRLRAVAEGRMRSDEELDPNAKFFVLALAPNAARLSVRYWQPGTLGNLAKAVTRFWDDMAIEPSPFVRGGVELPPKPWALLYDVAAQRDAANIPVGLGGDIMRAILTGGLYPTTWLAAVLRRIRVEGEPDSVNTDGRRAAAIAAILRRNYQQEVNMALNEEAHDAAYLLGRLFGAYCYAEKSYQARGAGLRQKYIGGASATPARVFPVLMRGYENNLASLRKAGGSKAGSGVKADQIVAKVIDKLEGEMPSTLTLEEQGRFFIGFYQQISAFYAKAEDAAEALAGEKETDSEELKA